MTQSRLVINSVILSHSLPRTSPSHSLGPLAQQEGS
jgi:hypothetical protein